MANVAFKKGLLANLPSTYSAGTFYVTTDERGMYLDISDSARIRLGDFQEFATVAALEANVNPSTSALYYVKEINCLAKWDGSQYVQINRDTGFTSFEITGDGNAITAVAIDETDGRKLILTKGATYMTAADVEAMIGELKIGDVEYDTVKAYVDKKAADTLAAAQGGSSETAASVSQALETYKTDNDARVEGIEGEIDALQEASAKHVEKEDGKSLIADTEIARLAGMSDGANKVESSETNGNIKIDGVETVVYTHPEKHTIAEVDGLQDALDGKQPVGDYATKTEAQAMADAKDEAIAAAQKTGDDAQDAVDALAGKVGEVPADKTVVQMISDAQTAATYDDTQVKADIAANTDAIALLNDGSTVEGSVDYKIAQAVAAIMENPDDTMNSINELVTWINGHAEDALELSNKVTANEEDIATLEDLVGTTAVSTQITEAIAGALKIDGVDKYALASDLTAAIARIAAIEADYLKKADKEELAQAITDGDAATLKSATDADAALKEELSGSIAEVDAKFDNYSTTEQMNAAIKVTDDKAVQAQNEVDALEIVVSDYKIANDAAVKTNTDAIDAIEADYLKTADKEELAEDIADVDAKFADVYTKTETYTQDEVDDAIANAVSTATTWVDF